MDDRELGRFLAARRAARRPQDAGLPGGGRRRAPGLRREELAALAAVSVDYLVRLEQGRQRDPSVEVLTALARALALDAAARRHLFALAGRLDPAPVEGAAREVPAALETLIGRAAPAPAWVLNRRTDLLAWNAPAEALLGPLSTRPEPNWLRLVFGAPAHRTLWADWALVAQDAVAHLRASGPPVPSALIRELKGVAPEFSALWEAREVRAACSPRRAARHPQAGPLDFDLTLLEAGDLRVVVHEPATDATREAWIAHLARGPQRLRAV